MRRTLRACLSLSFRSLHGNSPESSYNRRVSLMAIQDLSKAWSPPGLARHFFAGNAADFAGNEEDAYWCCPAGACSDRLNRLRHRIWPSMLRDLSLRPWNGSLQFSCLRLHVGGNARRKRRLLG